MGGRYALMLSKNGQSVLSLVDTGAAKSIISDTTLKYMFPDRNLMLKPFNGTLLAINDTPITVLGTIELTFDHVKCINCLVVPDIKHEFVIGLDSMQKGNAEININSQRNEI